jgi:polyhydroxybutyrate depolymerase
MSAVRALRALCVGALLLMARPSRAAFLPGDHLRALPFGGLVRIYRVHVPSGYDGSVPVPLVLDIHPLGANAEQQEAVSGMRGESDAHGFLVVYPQGVDDTWNAGICCGNATIDDVGFLRALVASISAEANIDGRRVYATGLSNGGAMSQRLACDAADLFAAVAPMAFPVPFRPLSACQPVRAKPVLTMMGLTDVVVPYNGGGFGSAPSTFAYWRDLDGCGSGAPDQVVERGRSRCETYTSCTQGARAGLCSVFANSFVGTSLEGHVVYFNDDFALADVAWQFLSSFTLPDVSPPAESVLAGRTKVKIGGRREPTSPLRWSFRVGAGTWGATTAAGTPLSGSWRPKRRNRRAGDVLLTTDSLTELSDALATTAGSDVALEPVGSLHMRTDRSGAAVSLRGRFRILRDGAPVGRYEVRLRRSR